MLGFHSLFYFFAGLCFLILIYFNRTKPGIFIFLIMLSYVLINAFKKNLGTEYLDSPYYINLSVLIPINLVLFYLAPQRKLFSKKNLYIIFLILAQIAVFEHLSANGFTIGYNFFSNAGLNELSLILFMVGTIVLLSVASYSGGIMQSYLLFAFIEIKFGFLYSDNPTALTIFFYTAILTTFIALSYDIYYSTYKDVLTKFFSRNSYIIQSKNFPLKYCVGIISIDDYDRLNKGLKKRELDAVVLMIANKINELEKDNPIYRYDKDEFVIIFKNENKNDSFDRVEIIRRAIASSEFIVSKNKKPIKLTISGSVSDKKRSDANSHEALVRARKILEKTNKFSQNVTTKA